jgi:HAD superfamily hydrolase (TIGR01459 family)
VTSGDVTVALIEERRNLPLHHIGPARDLTLFDAVEATTGARPRLAGADEAAFVVCTGLFDDEVETPADYEDRLRAMAARGLPFLCANPDLIVHRGAKVVYCAGALARRYEEIGGSAIYAGKPHAPIYDAALSAAQAALGQPLALARTLAIGDGMRTDIAGAMGRGLDALFISAGIHREEVHGDGPAEAFRLEALFAREGLTPYATARVLAP